MHEKRTDGLRLPAGAPAWVTPDMIALTVETWQPHYREEITEDIALEMLLTGDPIGSQAQSLDEVGWSSDTACDDQRNVSLRSARSR